MSLYLLTNLYFLLDIGKFHKLMTQSTGTQEVVRILTNALWATFKAHDFGRSKDLVLANKTRFCMISDFCNVYESKGDL